MHFLRSGRDAALSNDCLMFNVKLYCYVKNIQVIQVITFKKGRKGI